ncbi:mCG1042099, partial [Mus musculus]
MQGPKPSRGKDHLWPPEERGAGREKKNKPASQSDLEADWNRASNSNLLHQMPEQWPLFMHSSKGSLHQKAPSRINRQLILLVAEIHSHGKQSPALLLRRRIKSSGIKGNSSLPGHLGKAEHGKPECSHLAPT